MDGRTRIARALRAGMAGAVLVAATLLPPLRPLPFELCLFHRFSGLPCPTCGLTRSVCLLSQGNFQQGVAMHPAGPIALVLALGALFWNGAEAARGRLLWPRRQRALVTLLVAAGAVLSVASWAAQLLARFSRSG